MQLEVPFIRNIDGGTSVTEISAFLDKQAKYALEYAPWSKGTEMLPVVYFSIAYSHQQLLLKYYVSEPYYRLTKLQTNDAVYTDSCVEMFIMFSGEQEYYNLEFNSMGVCLGAHGADRSSRIALAASDLDLIRFQSQIHRTSDDGKWIKWELAVAIPVKLFSKSDVSTLHGRSATANFFKCGDELPVPHFLCWAPVAAPEPDFHLKQFFGEIIFL